MPARYFLNLFESIWTILLILDKKRVMLAIAIYYLEITNPLIYNTMNENVLLFIAISAVVVLAFIAFRNAIRREEKHQKDMDDLRKQISEWPHEKLVYVWGEYDKVCSMQNVGIPTLFFEMLELLEDECRKRGFK